MSKDEPLVLSGDHKILNPRNVYYNLSVAQLYEHAIHRGEAQLAADGPLIAWTGERTGRSPNDRFLVREPSTQDKIWWGKVNRPIAPEHFNSLAARIAAYLQGRDVYLFEGCAGAHDGYSMPVRVISEYAWHSLFARNMFVRKVRRTQPFTVVAAPGFRADPKRDGLDSPTFILIDLAQRLALIGGTAYAGEIKKSIFSVMNYYLPQNRVLSMHCSVNYGSDRDDAAVFFGLSGTGKTTLSADASRTLIGDDEHGWCEHSEQSPGGGVFNIEGGCYAKVIRLSPEGEPDIYATTRRFGTILENVVYDETSRELDLDSAEITENTRASYPVSHLANVDVDGLAGHPKHVVFLTCDAFGVLPPISRLTPDQAIYHFLSGYTAKVAGTERGVTEPKATFSACFGAPFMPLHPGDYARMLRERIEKHGVKVWLINTGWTGGPYGVGNRIQLKYTRQMVRAALSGALDDVPGAATDDGINLFHLDIPRQVEGVPSELLQPWKSWANMADYETKATELAQMFRDNFRQFEDGVDDEVKAAGPVRSDSVVAGR